MPYEGKAYEEADVQVGNLIYVSVYKLKEVIVVSAKEGRDSLKCCNSPDKYIFIKSFNAVDADYNVILPSSITKRTSKVSIVPIVDKSRYPSKCIRCGAPAYNGFNSTDCSKCGEY